MNEMLDYIIMFSIVLFLVIILLYKANFTVKNENFFDSQNSKAMRGFWCIVIILVHIPAIYQNRIQDMIGSFAYIGVTFFFMTSAYGLTISREMSNDSLKSFWCKRLLRIIIVSWIINILDALASFMLLNEKTSVINIVLLNDWIYWILACYFFFWISNLMFKCTTMWKVSTVVLVISSSIIIYYLKKTGVITMNVWVTEVFGFAWGVILASIRDTFVDYFVNKWWMRCSVFVTLSILLGIAYLRFKTISFIGDYILKIILGVSITLFILIVNTRVNLGNPISLYLGKISFCIYLIHLVVIDILKKAFNWSCSGVFILACIIVTISLSTIIHLLSCKLLKIIDIKTLV